MSFSDVWNTPGFFYAIGYSGALAIVLSQEKSEGGRLRKWLVWAAAWLFISVLMEATSGSEGAVYVFSMLAVVGALFGCMYNDCRDVTRAAFLSIKCFIYGELAASLSWQVYYALALRHPGLRTIPWLNIIMFSGFILIMSLIWLGERSLHRIGIEVIFSLRDVFSEILIVFSTYVISNLGYISPGSLFSGSSARDIFAIRTLVDFCGAILVYSFHWQLSEVQRRFEHDTLRGIRDMQYQAYQLSQESIDLINQKYHDLKHQIALLRTQAGSGAQEDSLRQIEQDIQKYEALLHTGHPVLDAVLTSKSLYCQGHGIELRFIADGVALSMMNDMEIAALFGNMLDNAIESVERVTDPEKRLIRLYVSAEKGFLRIRIENWCEEKLRFAGGLPVTTKQDRRYHGFGMKSMQHTVEKYGGSMVASQEGSWFALKILIPMGGQK